MSIVKERFNDKKIAILGLGTENIAFLQFLAKKQVEVEITICDAVSKEILEEKLSKVNLDFKFQTGRNYDAHLADFDIILRAPGYPLFSKNLVKAKKAGAEITSAMKLFFELCPSENIIGITGSKGKGTTSSLVYEILKSAFAEAMADKGGDLKKVFLGGNIGIAPFEFIEKIKSADFVVLELSSFQLEDLEQSPHIAVITNIFEEHLAPADPNNPNYHRSMKDYWAAKANIFAHQKKGDYLVINRKLYNRVMPAKAGIRDGESRVKIDTGLRRYDTKGKTVFYFKSELASNLIGEHNKENIAAAAAVAKILKIKDEVVKKAVKKFQGLPHRLEFVAEINGVKYFDDSFATVPDVSVIALKAITEDLLQLPLVKGERRIVLLAGGADKGSDFKNFAKEIKKRVKYLILFKGKGTERIKKYFPNSKFPLGLSSGRRQIPNSIVDNMKDAIAIAKKQAKSGDIILLSTGCASFGCFKNYKDRGDQFKTEVKRQK